MRGVSKRDKVQEMAELASVQIGSGRASSKGNVNYPDYEEPSLMLKIGIVLMGKEFQIRGMIRTTRLLKCSQRDMISILRKFPYDFRPREDRTRLCI